MKIFKRSLSVFLLLLLVISCSTTTMESQVDQLKAISKKHIADTRLEVFDIEKNGNIIEVRTSNANVFQEISALNNNHIKLTLLPEKSLETQYGVINLSAANIRSERRHGSELLTQGILGQPVKIFDQKGDWYKIQTPDKYLGWVDDYGVHPMTEKEMKSWNKADKIIFLEHAGFVYAEENSDGEIVSDIVLGNMLKLTGKTHRFYQVEFPDGRTGYVKKSEATTEQEWLDNIEVTGENLAAIAKKFMGVPYLWGGTSAKALDCSGFMKTVYFMHGIILQRDASQQALWGEEVSMAEDYAHLQIGDLIFFGSNPERITHVGLYLGDKEFIHEAGRVKINSLDPDAANYSGYRASSVRGVRRIIESVDKPGISSYKTHEFYK
ncbi:MAG: C40 family peptidase [Candidatus Marinimicrobia bacterium]|nr:C40 family peptidase [Candidatus Neomarinimicrobiota bacterium]